MDNQQRDYNAAHRKLGEATAEIERLRGLVREVVSGDWTNAVYAAELPSRLAESGWFKRARAALT